MRRESMGNKARGLLMIILGLGSVNSFAQFPSGYPADYAQIAAAAAKEGKLVLYSVTDAVAAGPLVKDFQALHPEVQIEFTDINSTELYNRFIRAAAGAGSADLLWSSAMDLQLRLVTDGYALAYQSPEAANLPAWAVWHNQAFGTTFAPEEIVYNKRLMPPEDVPKSHAELTGLLKNKLDKYRGKVASYDPERSGFGFMLATHDAEVSPSFWDLVRALGSSGTKLYTSTGVMLERISSGEHLLGYNMVGSYAQIRAKKDPAIGVIYPKDYTLVYSRILVIPKAAKHPNAAKLFVDYTLSKRGQEIMANQAQLYSIRPDVQGETTAANLTKMLGPSLKPIGVSADLLVYLDPAKRLAFL